MNIFKRITNTKAAELQAEHKMDVLSMGIDAEYSSLKENFIPPDSNRQVLIKMPYGFSGPEWRIAFYYRDQWVTIDHCEHTIFRNNIVKNPSRILCWRELPD